MTDLTDDAEFSPPLCRAARALLGWNQEELARASHLGKQTIADFERGARTPYPNTLIAMRRAFEDAGIAFMIDAETGQGLRLGAGASIGGMAAESLGHAVQESHAAVETLLGDIANLVRRHDLSEAVARELTDTVSRDLRPLTDKTGQ